MNSLDISARNRIRHESHDGSSQNTGKTAGPGCDEDKVGRPEIDIDYSNLNVLAKILLVYQISEDALVGFKSIVVD